LSAQRHSTEIESAGKGKIVDIIYRSNLNSDHFVMLLSLGTHANLCKI